MAHDISATLIVESGRHRTARAKLAVGFTSVGVSAANDLIISDLSGDRASFRLECRSYEVALHAEDAAVELGSGKSLQPGQSGCYRTSRHFNVGNVSFALEIERLPAENRRQSLLIGSARRKSALKGALATMALAVMWMSLNIVPLDVQSAEALAFDDLDVTGSVATTVGLAAEPLRERQQAALESLQQHLGSVKLDTLRASAKPDGSIVVSGEIAADQMAIWREVGRWFDGISGGRTVLVDSVNVTAAPQPLAIQAVWPGRNPYLVDGNGEKQFVGALLPSGWTIASIDNTRVLVKRGEQTLSVKF